MLPDASNDRDRRGRAAGRRRPLVRLAVALAGAAALAGCGTGQSADSPVASVKGVAQISDATLTHWMPVEAHVIYSEKPSQAPPAGVMPDPPEYRACTAFLAKYLAVNAPRAVKGAAALKRTCAKQYRELKVITLNTLIGWYWVIGQGEALGVTVTQKEVNERLMTVNKRLFATAQDFENYLRWTDETLSDMLFRSRVQLFETRIRERTLAEAKRAEAIRSPTQRQAALNRISEALSPQQRWVARTSCRAGFVVSSCAEYKGPLSPGLPD